MKAEDKDAALRVASAAAHTEVVCLLPGARAREASSTARDPIGLLKPAALSHDL